MGTWPRMLKNTNKLRSYVRGVRFGLFNGFESSPRGTILDKMLPFRLYFSRCYNSYFLMFLLFLSCVLLLEGLLHYIVIHYSIPSSTCLSSSLVLEFPLLLSQLFDFFGVKMISNTVQGSSPHKCGQESCCNAFNAVVAAFS